MRRARVGRDGELIKNHARFHPAAATGLGLNAPAQALVVPGWYGAARALLPYTGGALERLQGTRHIVQFSLSRNAIFPPLLFLETERGIRA